MKKIFQYIMLAVVTIVMASCTSGGTCDVFNNVRLYGSSNRTIVADTVFFVSASCEQRSYSSDV